MGSEEIADARPALDTIGHPARARAGPIHCATYVRAIIESTWAELAFAARHRRSRSLLMVQDPWTTAKWIQSPENWERFHALAGRVRDELITDPAERDIWERWKLRQCPQGHPGQPVATWQNDSNARMTTPHHPVGLGHDGPER